MRWTGPFLIVLALLSLGCARGDWISETMTLVDVTGTWDGTINRSLGGSDRTICWVLLQNGPKVTGEVQWLDGAPVGSIEGRVNGETFSWSMSGPFVRLSTSDAPSSTYRGEATVNSDELRGRADGVNCPCTFLLRRVSTEAFKEKKTQ